MNFGKRNMCKKFLERYFEGVHMERKEGCGSRNRLRLRFANEDDEEKVRDYLNVTWNAGEKIVNGGAGLEGFSSYKEWLEANIRNRSEDTVQEGMVPASTFLAFDNREELIGMIDLRHSLNKWLLMYGGHVGYSVRPSERGKGYASEMLGLVLHEARKLGIERILVTCDQNNAASRKVIMNNGGILENEVSGPGSDEVMQRYWILLKDR